MKIKDCRYLYWVVPLILGLVFIGNFLNFPFFVIGDKAKITIHLVTDEGKILRNFPCVASSWKFSPFNPPRDSENRTLQVDGMTDENGNVTFSLPCLYAQVSVGTKYGFSGYYPSGINYQFTNTVAGRCEPWNPIVDVVVNPIINPIPMYARAVGRTPVMDLPAKNFPVGFDLEAGDFVAPYGKGAVSDFIFTLTEKVPFVSYSQPFDISLNLSFSNKGDGIQSVIASPNQGSTLRLPRHAPEGGYQSTLIQETSRSSDGKVVNNQFNQEQNYFFRVRTVLDESGNVKSALYGKISGTLAYDFINSKNKTALMFFTYYLNPTPNDRNMEFDPSKNLFQNLPILQQVKAP